MTWYSVKKYKPIQYGKYIVLDNRGFCHVAYCETYTDDSYVFLNDDEEYTLNDVTHFMYIPPLEIDAGDVIKYEKK